MKEINYLSKDDFFEVKLGSMLASYDRDILTTLYQPIIGYKALALYFTLWSEVKRMEYSPLTKHEILLKEMDIGIDELYAARLKLEGIGLLRSYRSKVGKSSATYLYELYAPKTPQEFFEDIIFKGLLARKIGEREVQKLTMIFSSPEISHGDYEEISASFSSVYSLDEEESLKTITIKSSRGRKTINIRSNFAIGEFLKEIAQTAKISKSSFLPEDLEEISRIAVLFGFDVSEMSDIVSRIFDPNAVNHIDYDELYNMAKKYKEGNSLILDSKDEVNKEYNGDQEFAKKLNMMTQCSPIDYLRIKQNYTNPSPADVNILNILSSKYQLTAPVINALVDFTLTMCDNELHKSYIEKVGASLKRKGVTTALAACNALTRKRKPKPIENHAYHADDQNQTAQENTEEQISDEELNKLLEGF